MNQESVILLAEQCLPPDGTLSCCQTLGTWRGPFFEPASVPWAENTGREARNELSTATTLSRGRWALVHSRLWYGPTVFVLATPTSKNISDMSLVERQLCVRGLRSEN
jgi:hypothetical protein